MLTISQRLNEIEASLANISNIISQTFPSDDEIEAVRIEIFSVIQILEEEITALTNIVALMEQRINNYV